MSEKNARIIVDTLKRYLGYENEEDQSFAEFIGSSKASLSQWVNKPLSDAIASKLLAKVSEEIERRATTMQIIKKGEVKLLIQQDSEDISDLLQALPKLELLHQLIVVSLKPPEFKRDKRADELKKELAPLKDKYNIIGYPLTLQDAEQWCANQRISYELLEIK